MTLSLSLGIVGALLASLLYSVGAALQALEARRAPPEYALSTTLLRRLVVRPLWIVGTLCVLGGWLLQAGSLLLAPVTVVQPVLAVGLVSLIFIGVRVLGEEVGRRELLAVGAIVAGVVGLVLTGPGQSADHADTTVLAPAMAGLGLLALAPYALRSSTPQLVLIVLSAGLAFALCGLATSFAGDAAAAGRWTVLVIWLAVSGAGALLALVSEMTAFQRAPVTRVFPVVLVVQIVVAVGLAPVLGGESWAGDSLAVAGLAASLAMVAGGALALIGAPAVGGALATDRGRSEEVGGLC